MDFRLPLSALAVLVACSSAETPPEVPAEEAARLQGLLDEDPSVPLLNDVERAVRRELWGRGATLLRDRVLPAVQAQHDRVEAAELEAPTLRRLRREALRAYRARIAALEAYRDVLDGMGEDDFAMAAAVRAQVEAEQELLEVYDALAALREERTAR